MLYRVGQLVRVKHMTCLGDLEKLFPKDSPRYGQRLNPGRMWNNFISVSGKTFVVNRQVDKQKGHRAYVVGDGVIFNGGIYNYLLEPVNPVKPPKILNTVVSNGEIGSE